jgi:hypothetical protein
MLPAEGFSLQKLPDQLKGLALLGLVMLTLFAQLKIGMTGQIILDFFSDFLNV